MKRFLTLLLALFTVLGALAQEPYPELGAKLDEYLSALSGEEASVQARESDFLISSCQDSLVRQYVAVKIYQHYLQSPVMGDDAVALHVALEWFLSGRVAMPVEEDLLNARVFVEFNRHSLIGMQAPAISLRSPEGETVTVPEKGGYRVLYFYDTSCSTCKVESGRLARLIEENAFPITVYAIYTGTDAAAWEAYRPALGGMVHLWDPSLESDWQRLYGVLQTPKMYLVDPSGIIRGRGLDTPALRLLLNRELGKEDYVYGEESQMARLEQLFVPYGDTLKVSDVMDVADYLAARTFGEGNLTSFKQVMGDFLYFLSSRKTEVFRDAAAPFVQTYIQVPDIWTTQADQAQVVSLGQLLMELSSRTPVGSEVPDLQVYGTLRQRPCLLRRDGREGLYSLRKLKGKPTYLLFYSHGCSACQETLDAVDRIVRSQSKTRILLVDMDALFTDQPGLAQTLLDSFDLSALPMALELNPDGQVLHRYVDLTKIH